jgi:hypothetical protein
MRVRSCVLFLLLFLLHQSRAFSQSPPTAFSTTNPDTTNENEAANDNASYNNTGLPSSLTRPVLRDIHEFSIYSGQTFGYPLILSDLPGQRLFIAGARLTSHFIEFRHTTLNYNFDVKPLALYSNDVGGPRHYRYGGGGALGLQVMPHFHTRFRPFLDVNGGILAFTKETPIPDTRRINMTLDFGPGLYLPVGHNRALRTGVQFFHFSNAWTARLNPGFDSFFVYAAYTFENVHPW